MTADKSIFTTDPALGCPFDDHGMEMVEEWRGFKVGMLVGSNTAFTTFGQIVAIGENAKHFDGGRFVAFAVRVGHKVHILTHEEVHHIL